ncbi:transcription factor IIIB 90 kDa subunit-like isoform X1 [Montipora capricornis]|uniref:transcription factor IIIB 90 kDa subunit-like isoform X1 n=1 Tax=Montipora capricornis TaxID=246305 RepID=UPI0035F14381
MSRVCSNCGGSDIDIDQARGDAVCMGCGSVLEDNIIVSEVQFQENSLGGASAIGQFVSAEGNKAGVGLGSGFRHGLGQESRAVTLENGKRRINMVGHQLQMNQHCIDTAYNFYKLAVNKRLTRGRRTNHVVAACLYLVCRTERTPHMLLDFSDVLQVDVFTLGRTYLKLAQELYINLPAVDPCLYIHRFAHKLEFGEKEHEVAVTALRLVSRMKRDWIHHGRRPSGLCGAALLVSARLHGFCRTVREVVKTVRISDTTIRKRLGDFRETPSSQLTIDEFQTIDLEEEQDPPSFTAARRRAKQQLDELNNPEITSELHSFQNAINKALGIDPSTDLPTNSAQSTPMVVSENVTVNRACEVTVDGTSIFVPSLCKGEESTAEKECTEIETEKPTKDDEEDDEQAEELDLTGLDDAELDRCLLNNEEIEIKTKLWMEENRDYLEKLKEKEEKEAREREDGSKQETKKKRKPYKKRMTTGPASSAGEAIEKMLVEKKISSKINYEVLRDLETSQTNKPRKPQQTPIIEPVLPPKQEFVTPLVPTRRGGRKRDSSAAALPSEAIKKSKLLHSQSPVKEEPFNRIADHEVVIESGPVEYEKNDERNPVVEEDDFDELGEEDEEPISAAHLMGHLYNTGVEEEYVEYEDYE